MADLHALPLLGHDLPEPPAPQAPEKVKVFKVNDRWCWYHQCGEARDWGFWETAYRGAVSHARACC